jgi:hypothetical protein
MAGVRIKGYKNHIPDCAWSSGKGVGKTTYKAEGKIPCKRIQIMWQYLIPGQERVLEYIQTSVQQLKEGVEPRESEEALRQYLSLLQQVSGDEVASIARGNFKTLEGCFPEEELIIGRRYLRVDTGIVPRREYNRYRREGKLEEDFGFVDLLGNHGVEDFTFLILLENPTSLPSWGKMDSHLQGKVKNSEILRIFGNYSSYERVVEQMRFLYKVFKPLTTVANLVDKTDYKIDSTALSVIERRLNQINEGGQVVLGTEGDFLGILLPKEGNLESQETPQEAPRTRGYRVDFSTN